jgi:hypothetical protein
MLPFLANLEPILKNRTIFQIKHGAVILGVIGYTSPNILLGGGD